MTRRVNGSGALYKDKKSGRWIGEVDIDGKRRRVKAHTKVDASARLGRLIAQGDAGIVRPDGNATVQQLLDLWRDRTLANKELAPKSRENYHYALTTLSEEFGTVRLRSLTIDRVERGLDAIASGKHGRGRPLSKRAMKLMRSTFTQVLDLAVRRRLLPGNPAHHAELRASAARTRPRRALTMDEARALWQVLDDNRLAPAFKLMMTTTMRPGEAYGLCFDSIDLDTGELILRRAVQVAAGRPRLVTTLKTDSAERRVVVPAPALEVLRAHRPAIAQMKLALREWPKSDPGLVFPTSNGGVWDPSNARRELAKAAGRAGIAPVSPGELRHTAKAILDDEHVDPVVIRNLMGHSTEWMQDHYGKRRRPAVDGHVAVMNRVFGSLDR